MKHQRPKAKLRFGTALLVTLLLTLTGCSAETLTKDISRAEYEADGKVWPFTMDEGAVKCTEPYIATFVVDDTEYALNIWAEREDWTHDKESVMAEGMKSELDFRYVLEDATDLCDELNS